MTPGRRSGSASGRTHRTGFKVSAEVTRVSDQRERLHRLLDKLPEERVDEVTDVLELVAAEVMLDLEELLQERERRSAEAYARGYGEAMGGDSCTIRLL